SIIGFELRWSTGKRETGASKKQLNFLYEIYKEVEMRLFDYFSIKDTNNLETARKNILKLKDINRQADEKLTSEMAKELIWESKLLYRQLQTLLEKDGKERDT